MRFVLLGAPGSGKGTQTELVVRHYDVPLVALPDLVREWAQEQSEKRVRTLKCGDLFFSQIPEETVMTLLRRRLSAPDARRGFLIDCYPRSRSQAESLDRLLESMGMPLQVAILVEVDHELLVERLSGRRTCTSCGTVYNIYTSPPKIDGQCDECGGNLKHRGDDNEATIDNRLRAFEAQMRPVIDYYREKGLLEVVDGSGEIESVFGRIRRLLDTLPHEPPKEVPSEEDDGIERIGSMLEKMMNRAREGEAVGSPMRAPEATTPKRAAPKRAAPKRAAPKKAAPKKAAPKKAAPKKATPKKAAPKKASPKKASPKKAAPKKAAPKKAAPKKTAPKKAAPKKAAPKRAAPKKAAPKKAAKKKAAKKKAAKKKAAKKGRRR